MSGNTSSAVMQRRHVSRDGLDLFPTPPWAVRGFIHHMLPKIIGKKVWEPAAGKGHMVHVLRGLGCDVFASDIVDHGQLGEPLDAVGDFLCEMSPVEPSFADGSGQADWIFSNPPFNAAAAFLKMALQRADNVALLCRIAFLEGQGRYNELFTSHPPSIVAVHAERVPMCKDVWDPTLSSASCYAWYVWSGQGSGVTELRHVPPDCKANFFLPEDLPFAEKRSPKPSETGDENKPELKFMRREG